MPRGEGAGTRDVGIRLAGALLIVLCVLAATQASRTGQALPPGRSSLPEMALAAIAFICFSLGSGMTLLGSHLFDDVEVSARWARRPSMRR